MNDQLPAILSELIYDLSEMDLSQNEIANYLSISQPRVAQYLNKRNKNKTEIDRKLKDISYFLASEIILGEKIENLICKICNAYSFTPKTVYNKANIDFGFLIKEKINFESVITSLLLNPCFSEYLPLLGTKILYLFKDELEINYQFGFEATIFKLLDGIIKLDSLKITDNNYLFEEIKSINNLNLMMRGVIFTHIDDNGNHFVATLKKMKVIELDHSLKNLNQSTFDLSDVFGAFYQDNSFLMVFFKDIKILENIFH